MKLYVKVFLRLRQRHILQPSRYKEENNIRSNNNYKSAHGFLMKYPLGFSKPLEKRRFCNLSYCKVMKVIDKSL